MSVKLGVIGFQHFHVHGTIQNMQAMEGVQLVALAEREDSLRDEMALRYKVPAYADYVELLDRETPDAVMLCAINSEKAGIICECAERGVHVFADKPIATTMDDLARVKRAVAEHRIRLSMLGPGSQTLRDIIAGGELGEVVYLLRLSPHRWDLTERFGWARPRWNYDQELYGGGFLTDGVTGINGARWLLGKEVREITAHQSNKKFTQYEDFQDNFNILLRMEDGATAFIVFHWFTPAAEPSHGRGATYIYGTKGQIEVTSHGRAGGLEAGQGAGPTVTMCTEEQPPHEISQERRVGREEDFIRSIVEGTPPALADEFVMESMRLALLARDSAEQHRTITVT